MRILKDHLRNFFVIPHTLRSEFWQDTLKQNRLSLLVICLMIFGMELFNMARVLFWSASGLDSHNNRIYFFMYCALFGSAALYLLLRHLLRSSSMRVRWAVQYGAVLFFLLWHVCLNAYDLIRDPTAEVGIYTTAVLGLSIFIQMPPVFSILCHGTAYALFMLLSGPILSSGTRLNLTITAIVALAVSLTSCRHAVVLTAQRLEISQMNQRLQALVQRDPLTGLLNKAAFQNSAELYLQHTGPETETALLIADLDDFKSVNDLHGHPCGDFVLKETARQLQAAFPDAVGVSRIGGDEFAVLVPNLDAASLRSAAESLIQRVREISWDGRRVGTGCSVGICRSRRLNVSFEQLYGEADQALYAAKRHGKGQCHICRLS